MQQFDDPLFHQNDFAGYETQPMGLVQEPPGSEGIGLAGAAPPPMVPPPAAPNMPAAPAKQKGPFDDVGMLGKIGLAVQAFGAGGMGQTPMLMQLRAQKLEERKQKQQEMVQQFEIAEKLTKVAAPLQGTEREEFINRSIEQYASDNPTFGNFIRAATKRPDLLKTLPAAAQQDPMLKSLIAAGDTDGAHKYYLSEAGQKNINRLATGVYMKEFTGKINPLIEWYEKNEKEKIDRIRKDGVVTIAELRDLHDSAPIHLQVSPEAFTNVTAPENQERLVGFGLKILPDKTVAEIEKERHTEKGDPEIVKLQTQRDNLIAQNTAESDPEKKANLNRKVAEINKRIANLQTSGATDPGTVRANRINMFADNYRQDTAALKKLSMHVSTAQALIDQAEQTLKAGGDVAAFDKALKKIVMEMFDTGQVAAVESKEWKNFGELPTRFVGALSQFMRDSYTTEQRAQLKSLVARMDASVVSPALQQVDDRYVNLGKSFEFTLEEIGGQSPSKKPPKVADTDAASTSVAKPKTQAEYAKIPKGARYIHPKDGKERIKQ